MAKTPKTRSASPYLTGGPSTSCESPAGEAAEVFKKRERAGDPIYFQTASLPLVIVGRNENSDSIWCLRA